MAETVKDISLLKVHMPSFAKYCSLKTTTTSDYVISNEYEPDSIDWKLRGKSNEYIKTNPYIMNTNLMNISITKTTNSDYAHLDVIRTEPYTKSELYANPAKEDVAEIL